MPFLVGAHDDVTADVDSVTCEVDILNAERRDLAAPQRAGGCEHDADPQLCVFLGSGQSPFDGEDVRDIQSGTRLLGHIDDRHPDLLGLQDRRYESDIVLYGLRREPGADQRIDQRLHIVGADREYSSIPKPWSTGLYLACYVFIASDRGRTECRLSQEQEVINGHLESTGSVIDFPVLINPGCSIAKNLLLVRTRE